MKTAVSIPDPLFDAAEKVAGRLRISRSRLYAEAIAKFLKSHPRKGIREALDSVYAAEDSGLDPLLTALQSKSLSREDW